MGDAGGGEAGGGGPSALTSEQQQAVDGLRSAFSHLEHDDVTIAAWLTTGQRQALDAYRAAYGKAAKREWALEELLATDEELVQIGAFKDRLQAEGQLEEEQSKAYATDLRLLQYLRAREHVLDKSYAMFLHTLDWRRTHEPWALENQNSRTNKTCSDERIVGFDVDGRVVVYSSFANTTIRVPKEVEVNVTAMMEKAAQCVNARTPGNLIWVNNFSARHKNGFGWRDCNPAFFFSGIDIFLNHYPECLKTMVIVDPPSIFYTTWSIVKPLLAPKTQQKAEILDSRKESTRQRFIELFGQELGTFLIEQIRRDEDA